jgi:hypothetical protein
VESETAVGMAVKRFEQRVGESDELRRHRDRAVEVWDVKP